MAMVSFSCQTRQGVIGSLFFSSHPLHAIVAKVGAFRQSVSAVMDPAVLVSIGETEMSCCDRNKMTRMKVAFKACLLTGYGCTAQYFLIVWNWSEGSRLHNGEHITMCQDKNFTQIGTTLCWFSWQIMFMLKIWIQIHISISFLIILYIPVFIPAASTTWSIQ